MANRPATQLTPLGSARYVGSTACVSCHRTEAGEWRQSQHRQAMQAAVSQTVLGDFDNTHFSNAGVTSTFFKHDGKYFVRTDNRKGQLANFQVKYTFGVYPLQQYLIELSDGRLQALSIAWDARRPEQGGQRWFHLYAGEQVSHDDELHWTHPSQNWNFMCADCHSTAVQKNYDTLTNRFKTRWAELSVGCEACHGPGSAHQQWALAKRSGKSTRDSLTKGLTVALDERRQVSWRLNPSTGYAARSQPRKDEREVEVCAQCHSRRAQIADGYEPGRRLVDYYIPALLTRPLYHADGQQHDEVYDWGSFQQSRMFASGVTCSDCHNPHSGETREQGNAVCTSCHLPSKFNTPDHHHHDVAGAGASCAGCHMPATTYMSVDRRHDHSFRVPRPDLSVRLGTPNACTNCHTNRDASWAASQVNAWYGPKRAPSRFERYAAALAAADHGADDAQDRLLAVASDRSQPPLARATALAEVQLDGTPTPPSQVTDALYDPNPMVRLGALQSLSGLLPYMRLPLAAPLLTDPTRTIRIEAARLLAAAPIGLLTRERRGAFERAAQEYVAAQGFNGDRADARVNLAMFHADRGDAKAAELQIKVAILLDPLYLPAYVNLADVYRTEGRDSDGERALNDGIALAPNSGLLHYALGLTLVRLRRTDDALAALERATKLEPDNARFAYAYAVALHSTGKVNEAIANLDRARASHPNDNDIRNALSAFQQGRTEGAPKP